MTHRVCKDCEENKPLTEFRKQKGYYRRVCKACTYTKSRKRTPEENREANLQKKFGISVQDYEQMEADQEGLCKICKEPETAVWKGKVIRLAVDHCHTTGKVRGLLCVKCNNALGNFNDDVDLLKEAIKYIEESA